MYCIKLPTQEVYAQLSEWWGHFKWPAPPIESLPSTCFVVPNICAVFLYETGTNVGIMEWMISSPEATPEQKGEGIAKLVEKVAEHAGEVGVKNILTFTPHRKLISRLEGHGFKVLEEHTVILRGEVK